MNYLKWMRAQWDRISAVLAVIGGGIALLLGWMGVGHTAFSAEQTPYLISGGILGLFLLGIGGTLWISADLRDEWHKLDRLEQSMTPESDRPAAQMGATERGLGQ